MAELRRMRPLLGTFVEIRVRGASRETLRRASDRAFAAVARVHGLMSFHDPESDLSRLNRSAVNGPVAVDSWTFRVLAAAQRFSQISDGVFDVTAGGRLMERGWLPRPKDFRTSASASWRDVELLPDQYVRFRQPVVLDLGGIAKGFAVDRAIEVLKRAGVPWGVINAGGDLRVYGDRGILVRVRHPQAPWREGARVRLRNQAMASSAGYFTRRTGTNAWELPLVNGQSGAPVASRASVSVKAALCMNADALTKMVFADPARCRPVLRSMRAEAVVLQPA